MADTPSVLSEEPTMEEAYIPFFTSLHNVFKEHQALLSSMPEAMECLLQRCSPKINEIQHSEGNRYQKWRGEELEMREELSKKEEETTKKEREIIQREQHLEEAYQKWRDKEQQVREELLKKEEETTKKEREIIEREQQLEEAYKKWMMREEISNKEEKTTKKEREMREREQQLKEALSKKDAELQQLCDKHNKIFEEYKSRTESLDGEIKAKEYEIKQLSQRLSQANQELEDAHSKVEDYKSRLASLSEKNVKRDQTHVENILESNRQSKLEKDFSDFFDDERLDACDKMQSIYGHQEEDFVYMYYPRLACIIFETAYEQAKEVHEAASHSFKEITKLMITNAADMGKKLLAARKEGTSKVHDFSFTFPQWGGGLDYLKDVMDGMTLSMKEAAPTCSLPYSLTRDVAQISLTKWKKWYYDDTTCMFEPSRQVLENLVKYINDCIKLTWKMVTQIPPMKLEYHSFKFNKEIHINVTRIQKRKHSSTQENQDGEIKFYIWPGLQDGKGRRIRPGEVLCKFK